MKLDTIGGVAAEQGRIYRLAINQKIKTAEAARLTYILREVRCSLEAIPPTTPDQTTAFGIVSVPVNHFIRTVEEVSAAGSALVIEHMPSESIPEKIDSAQTIEPEPIAQLVPQEIEPRSPEETQLLAELNGLSREELMRRAGVSDVDHTLSG
jgi:hypothetical protein